MNAKKIAAAFIAAMCLSLGGCSGSPSVSVKSNISYTFLVDTGDNVKITLDTTDDYSMTSDLPFVISKSGETLTQGTFITADTYRSYVDLIESQDNTEMLDSGSKDGIEYIFWSFEDEFDYAILLENSDTGVLLGNNISKESAVECFERMTFSLEK